MKTILAFSLLSLSFSALGASPDSVIELSKDVTRHLESNAYSMNRRELSRVNAQLERILNGGGGGGGGGRAQYLCTSGDNKLKDLRTGEIIYDFGSPSSCQAAKESLKTKGTFCTDGDNKLMGRRGGMIYDFGSPSSCRRASDDVFRYGAFCTDGDNKLYRRDGTMIHDFGSPSACRNALEDL